MNASTPASHGALGGIRVVDLAGTVATAYCGKLFADYGAEVINLEPAHGFPTRRLAPFVDTEDDGEASAMHAYLSTKKASVRACDVSDAGLRQLVASADLVLDDDTSPLREEVKGILSTITWYGKTGPYADYAGGDGLAFALNGMVRSLGRVEGPPLVPTGYQSQIVGGKTAFIASMTQVLGRELGNLDADARCDIDTSIFEAALCFTDVGAIAHFNTGLQAPRMGVNRFPPTYPLGVFPCRDGWIGLTVLTPSQWHTFCRLLDMEEFAHVPLFQSSIGRLESLDVLEPIIREKLLEHSAEALFYRAQESAVPLARVPTMEELFEVDQYAQREAFTSATLSSGRELTVPSVPFRLYAVPPTLGGSVAGLGANTREFL